jgi:predicted anti-sigma-YlaC factor YlaD
MQHDVFKEKVSLWLDNELNAGEVSELQQHLAQCPACQHAYQTIQQIHHLFRDASTSIATPAPGFTTRFEARLAGYSATKRWHMWAGLVTLLLGAVFLLTIGAAVVGLTLLGTGAAWFSTSSLYYALGLIGELVNQARLLTNLVGLGLKVALLTMNQPLFWVFVLVALGLAGFWVRLLRSVYRRETVTGQLFV